MRQTLISKESWDRFLEQFGRQHRGWLTSIETVRADERTKVLATDTRLEDVSLESDERVQVTVTDKAQADEPIVHVIDKPARIFMEMTDDRKHAGLRVETVDNESHNLVFRAAAAPETLDGLA